MKRNVAITVVLCLVFAALVVAGFVNRLSQPRILTDHELREYGAIMLETPREFSDVAMVDHHGEPFTREDLTGQWTLVFFGFTHCPDICPTTMAMLDKVYAQLEPDEKADVQVVMVSVDPERDTVANLEQYVTYFNGDFVGVRAEPAQLLSLTTQLSVVYDKVPLEGGEYTVDHSGNIVIINPRGHYHGFFRPPFEEGNIRVALRSLMNDFER